jgi:hypothetical protein
VALPGAVAGTPTELVPVERRPVGALERLDVVHRRLGGVGPEVEAADLLEDLDRLVGRSAVEVAARQVVGGLLTRVRAGVRSIRRRFTVGVVAVVVTSTRCERNGQQASSERRHRGQRRGLLLEHEADPGRARAAEAFGVDGVRVLRD